MLEAQSNIKKINEARHADVSMVSSHNLAYMQLRLEELFGGNEWFGARNMLFVGDIL